MGWGFGSPPLDCSVRRRAMLCETMMFSLQYGSPRLLRTMRDPPGPRASLAALPCVSCSRQRPPPSKCSGLLSSRGTLRQNGTESYPTPPRWNRACPQSEPGRGGMGWGKTLRLVFAVRGDADDVVTASTGLREEGAAKPPPAAILRAQSIGKRLSNGVNRVCRSVIDAVGPSKAGIPAWRIAVGAIFVDSSLLFGGLQTDVLQRLTRHLHKEDKGDHWPEALDFELKGGSAPGARPRAGQSSSAHRARARI